MEPAMRPPLILIANDQEWSARSLESIFAGEGYLVERAFTGNQALQRAEASRPDVIILDRQMPDLGGVEVCRRLRADPRFGATTPILITTAGQAGRPQRVEAFSAGAWDFVGQPIDGEIILLKIRTFLQAKQAIDGSRVDGLIDPGTGLYTRQGLVRRSREIASEARREHQALTCVVFTPELPTLENALLSVEAFAQEIAGFFRAAGRSSDAVARLSPLEFGVIAPATSEDGVARLVERLESATTAFSDAAYNLEGRIGLRAGYCSVADYADSPIDPLAMIEQASASIKAPIEARPTR